MTTMQILIVLCGLAAVLYGVVNALFLDSPTSCVLLGQRNVEQVEVASFLGDVLSSEDTNWVKSLYNN